MDWRRRARRQPLATDLGPARGACAETALTTVRSVPRLLSPIDLQCIKASGVTFAVSAIERVIEERARGDAARAEAVRADLRDRVGADIRTVKPGSEDARG